MGLPMRFRSLGPIGGIASPGLGPYPQYGGTNGVEPLDIGQSGTTALWTGRVIRNEAETYIVDQSVVKQNVKFRDELGYRGMKVTWRGAIRVTSATMIQSILSRLDKYKTGSMRINGVLGPPDVNLLKETRLTDSYGNVISEKARLSRWTAGPAYRLSGVGPYTHCITDVAIEFELLG